MSSHLLSYSPEFQFWVPDRLSLASDLSGSCSPVCQAVSPEWFGLHVLCLLQMLSRTPGAKKHAWSVEIASSPWPLLLSPSLTLLCPPWLGVAREPVGLPLPVVSSTRICLFMIHLLLHYYVLCYHMKL